MCFILDFIGSNEGEGFTPLKGMRFLLMNWEKKRRLTLDFIGSNDGEGFTPLEGILV